MPNSVEKFQIISHFHKTALFIHLSCLSYSRYLFLYFLSAIYSPVHVLYYVPLALWFITTGLHTWSFLFSDYIHAFQHFTMCIRLFLYVFIECVD